uniref:Short-chain dehydrogenase/reductase family 42E member 1 isoform X1 n=1 Tax=Petromyzon marinus TaxID=7757 RepID=A0AAJ7U6B9_PETMA|nr:short-chain dehydrogenase/reductase family 42E member 1 isoform X1 [Petromyzon marinus]
MQFVPVKGGEKRGAAAWIKHEEEQREISPSDKSLSVTRRQTTWISHRGHCRLGAALAAQGHRVLLLDLVPPPPSVPLAPGIDFRQGDVTDERCLESAFAGADCVFHTASFGMSGREQLKRRRIEDVNVGGTEAVLRACVSACVPRLVYTSTYNVVFGGQVIENGDESLPYLPLHKHPDNYSRTKAVAEMAVLRADGSALASHRPGALRTCALRPAGIYGPGERRHLPRVVSYIERGLFAFVYGRPDSRVDFVHVDNLVDAHALAADALRAGRGSPAGGQAYFVSDGRPVNNFEFFRPLVEGLGYEFPRARLPLLVVYAVAFLTELLHAAVGWAVDFQPLLTRAEVYKTGVTHHFSVGKARRELGYAPAEKEFGEVVEWFRQRGHGKRRRQQQQRRRHGRFGPVLRDLVLVAIFAALVLAFLPTVTTALLDS